MSDSALQCRKRTDTIFTRLFVKVHLRYPIRMATIYFFCLVIVIMVAIIVKTPGSPVSPNIVLIVADDLGWDDVSFHGSDQVFTPNIDLLAYSGVALSRYYSHSICTPSRSALLTGKYSHITGMQGYPITNGEDRGLPLTEKILPQYLKELGYATHLVGKWHVGHSRNDYLPTFRGFDSHFGNRGGFIDYYEYTSEEVWGGESVSGIDLFRNASVAWDTEGYITDIYTQEAKTIIQNHEDSKPLFLMVSHNAPHGGNDGALLQAPPADVRTMRHVESPERRIFAAMIKKLDDSVGVIVKTLHEKGILSNTIIIFVSDNGGMTSGNAINYSSNWPLRGLKMSPYEGGIRVAGLLWTQTMSVSNHLWNGYMHVSDWLPTLLGAIGADVPPDVDGFNQWNNIHLGKPSDREEIFEIDDYTGYESIISGDYKLITGNVIVDHSTYQGGNFRDIINNGPSYTNLLQSSDMYSVLDKIGKSFNIADINIRENIRLTCSIPNTICFSHNSTGCLYNIKVDPCETNNLYDMYPDIVEALRSRLLAEKSRVIPRKVPVFRDPRAKPRLHNFTWTTFMNNMLVKNY